jgi:hypothetical protein
MLRASLFLVALQAALLHGRGQVFQTATLALQSMQPSVTDWP